MRTAYHRVQMAPDGREIVRAMRLAIERSGRSPDEIGYVNYHGTSTQMNDAVESRSVRELFGRRADSGAGIVDEVDGGAPAGGQWGPRHRDGGPRARPGRSPADHQLGAAGSGVRNGFHSACCPSGTTRGGALQLSRFRFEEQRARTRLRVRQGGHHRSYSVFHGEFERQDLSLWAGDSCVRVER